jgi:dethiobiotin synthetase
MNSAHGVFVTGTDTGIGKTLIACAVLDLLGKAGVSTCGFKPVAAGARLTAQGLRNDDAEQLMAHSSVALEYEEINPVVLKEAIAPHIAADHAGVEIRIDALARHYEALTARARHVVVEGAGGWLVPLGGGKSVADLATALGAPVVLVVGLRLGCLNHALLTAEDIRRRGLTLLGWVANSVDPAMPEQEANIATLDEAIPAPRLGHVPWLEEADQATRVARASTCLNPESFRHLSAKPLK